MLLGKNGYLTLGVEEVVAAKEDAISTSLRISLKAADEYAPEFVAV